MAIQADHVEEVTDQTRTVSAKSEEGLGEKNEYDDVAAAKQSHVAHPEPWRYEKWIPGGYSQSRMLRFKNPSTMYKVINLFAGKLPLQDRQTDRQENGKEEREDRLTGQVSRFASTGMTRVLWPWST